MWTAGSWFLHYDNAPAHTPLSIRKFLAKHLNPIIPRPFYSPNLSPPNYFLFAKHKITLKGKKIQMVEDITNLTNGLKTIALISFEEFFQSGKGNGRGALLHKGTVLKGIILNMLQAEKYIIHRQISGIF